jgi:hypothetical protein
MSGQLAETSYSTGEPRSIRQLRPDTGVDLGAHARMRNAFGFLSSLPYG